MPSLGEFHKTLCDCLGIWNSDNSEFTFTVPATEQTRRRVLGQAFEAIKRPDGRYGSLGELVAVTSQIAPQAATLIRKDRSVQSLVQGAARSDFASYEECTELTVYVEALIAERYERYEVQQLAICFYRAAMLHYQEFLRECPATGVNTYAFFIKFTLMQVLDVLVEDSPAGRIWPSCMSKSSQWPLLDFIDGALQQCGVSRYRLFQFHESAKTPAASAADVWARDLKSIAADTRSKQTLARFSKANKIKFSHVFETIRPLASLLTEKIDSRTFATRVFQAFMRHNLNLQLTTCTAGAPSWHGNPYPAPASLGAVFPVSHTLDKISERLESLQPGDIDPVMSIYRAYTQTLMKWSCLEDGDFKIPRALDFIYGSAYRSLGAERWYERIAQPTHWMDQWRQAVQAAGQGEHEQARDFFYRALQGAKYTAGPLFMPLYVEICAFCKRQYKRLQGSAEDQMFDAKFGDLGKQAADYAELLGYSPAVYRNPETLIPYVRLRVKNGLIVRKIDSLI